MSISVRVALTLAVLTVLGACGSGSSGVPLGSGAPSSGMTTPVERTYPLASAVLGQTLEQIYIEQPALPDGAERPLLVLLPAFGMYPPGVRKLIDEVPTGPDAPNIAIVNGGQGSFYHDRASGAWGTYLQTEAIPVAVRELHADPDRIAIGGISMGGFGAFELARESPYRFCAIGGHSPAIYEEGDPDMSPIAFDDAADFARHGLLRAAAEAPSAWKGIPLWIDVGTDDPYAAADRAFAHRLRVAGHDVTFHEWPGEHDGSYWSAHMKGYLAFYEKALAGCRRTNGTRPAP